MFLRQDSSAIARRCITWRYSVTDLPFIKMHGLGNDFVIVRGRERDFTPQQAAAIADRRLGIGCDQFIVIEPPQATEADFFMRIYNPDGSQAQACGNGTRCAAHLWMAERGRDACVVQTLAGLLACRRTDDGMIEVDMGLPRLDWQDIPLAEPRDTLNPGFALSGIRLPDPALVSMGNPHAVFFVDDVDVIDVEGLGRPVETHPLFPQRTNVEFAQVMAPGKIRVRVWERGAGLTRACGSGACAVIVAAVRRDLAARRAEIALDGGSLFLEWREADGHVLMTGPANAVFSGRLDLAMTGKN